MCEASSKTLSCIALRKFVTRTRFSHSLSKRCVFTGGYDGTTFLDSVECYDPETDTWSEVTHMTSGRSGVGVAVTMEPCQKGLSQCQQTGDCESSSAGLSTSWSISNSPCNSVPFDKGT